MSQYHTFTAQDAVAYAQQFGGIDNPSELVSAGSGRRQPQSGV
jgi:5-methylthioribose kinase